ncbi:MAG: DUF4935 domain-containing protein [Acidobacteria bacterium]|nr:DUF4935 domain-containing protein [Acidobacteriota bacterium]
MVHLVIDTCIWIDLYRNFPKLLQKITLLLDQKKICLILPVIVIEEWNKHRDKILEERSQSIRGKIKNARELSKYLNPEQAETLNEMLDNLQEDLIKKVALAGIEEIEDLFKRPSTIMLTISDEVKIRTIDFALAKKAPFRNKNSTADALILFSSAEYIADNDIKQSMFVSINTDDFSSSADKEQISEDLKELLEKCGMKYFTNIGLAINTVQADLVSEDTIQQVETKKAAEEIGRRLVESLGSIGSLSAIDEIARKNQQLMESLGKAGGLSSISESAKAAETIGRHLAESLASIGSLSAIDEIARRMREYDHLMRDIRTAGGLTDMTEPFKTADERIPEIIGEEFTVPDNQEHVSETDRNEVESPDDIKTDK